MTSQQSVVWEADALPSELLAQLAVPLFEVSGGSFTNVLRRALPAGLRYTSVNPHDLLLSSAVSASGAAAAAVWRSDCEPQVVENQDRISTAAV